MSNFRTDFGKTIFQNKYWHEGAETWEKLSNLVVDDVCSGKLSKDELSELKEIHRKMQFIAGGRYLYYAGRDNKFYNNCFLLKAECDSREDWASLSWKAESCLMTGGGIGCDYSVYRPKGEQIKRTGGVASGSISKMKIINEIGREVMQGGSRRSAIFASLNWKHGDINELLHVKDWYNLKIAGAFDLLGNHLSVGKVKETDFNFPAPLDMTNISINYDNAFLEEIYQLPINVIKGRLENKGNLFIENIPDVFYRNVHQALKTGEPGFAFNFFEKEKETLKNACGEICSEDDSDVCNLGSINMANVDSIEDFRKCVRLGVRFLLCGTLVAKLPYEKMYKVREKNRRLGLGLLGVHEWLLKRGYRYKVVSELHEWLKVYKEESEKSAIELADKLNISRPKAFRAIAPTGTIGILAGTTTGIEPLIAIAYKRRYLKNKFDWKYQYVIDGTAKHLINEHGLNPNEIETALGLAKDPERRIKFQADVQDYVDQAIASTINLPAWGTELNNENNIKDFAYILVKYAHRLRGFTCYPDMARGGQPLVPVSYEMASLNEGEEFEERCHDVCEMSGKGGVCGV